MRLARGRSLTRPFHLPPLRHQHQIHLILRTDPPLPPLAHAHRNRRPPLCEPLGLALDGRDAPPLAIIRMDSDAVRPDRLHGLILLDLLLLPTKQHTRRMVQEPRRVGRVDRERRMREHEGDLHVARISNFRRQQRPQLPFQRFGVPPGHGPPDREALVLRPIFAEAVDPRTEPALDAGGHALGRPCPAEAELPFFQAFDVVPVPAAVGAAQDEREEVQAEVEVFAGFGLAAVAPDADHGDGGQAELGFEEFLEGGRVGAEAGVVEGSAGCVLGEGGASDGVGCEVDGGFVYVWGEG